MTGFTIRDIQTRLTALGFNPGPIDGVVGPKTNAAIVAFKRSVGLRARPYVGPITRAALVSADGDMEVPWLDEATHIMGLHEARDRSQLVKWFDKSVSWFDPREVPWCGAFVATAFRKWDPDIEIPENPLLARNWDRFGQACAPQFGAVMRFWRGSPSSLYGHVAFYVGESPDAYRVRGGNQRNTVNDTWIAKDRLVQSRWAHEHPQPRRRVFLNSKGARLSTNEF